MSVKSFLDEFEKWTEQVTTCGLPIPGCRRYEGKVDVQVVHFPHRGKTSVYLAMMSSLQRGKGHGSQALQFLCDLADRHNITLVGKASTQQIWGHWDPVKREHVQNTGPRLDYEQLVSWYRRHGFVVDSKNGDMRREPTRKSAVRRQRAAGGEKHGKETKSW